MTAEEMWNAALVAGRALSALPKPGPVVTIGCGLSIDLVRDLARVAGVQVKAHGPYVKDFLWGAAAGGLYVIEGIEVRSGGVDIRAQGSRDATPEEVAAANALGKALVEGAARADAVKP